MNRLSLGTAQFGLKYGITNQAEKIKFSQAKEILKLAKKNNINLIDTAMSYGESEKIIGDTGIKDFKIVTKLPPSLKDCKSVRSWVEKNVESSLRNLGVSSIYGLLVHRSENLLGDLGKKLIHTLDQIKLNGLVKKIGVSIYDPSELDKIMNLKKFDIIQAPLNIVDRRLETSGWLSKLYKLGVEVHIRSIFLQGLLLIKHNKIPKIFNKWQNIFDKWMLELERDNLNPINECLSYPLNLPEVHRIIVGVDNISQFQEIIGISSFQRSKKNWSFMASNDQMLVNPYNWKKL